MKNILSILFRSKRQELSDEQLKRLAINKARAFERSHRRAIIAQVEHDIELKKQKQREMEFAYQIRPTDQKVRDLIEELRLPDF